MIQRQKLSTLERIVHVRQRLNIYNEILSSMIDLINLKLNDLEYDPSRRIKTIQKTIEAEEENWEGSLQVEIVCCYRFDFVTVKRMLTLLNAAWTGDDEPIKASLKIMRTDLRRHEEDTRREQTQHLPLRGSDIFLKLR